MFYSKKKETPPKPTPLEELRTCVTRMETLLEQTKTKHEEMIQKSKKKKKKSASKKKNHPLEEDDTIPHNDHNFREISKFISMEKAVEEELVELIRRIAELVVCGERYAAIGNNNNATSISMKDDDTANSEGTEKTLSEEEIQSHLAVFEYFCEKNIFGVFLKIVTGVAFTKNHGYDSNDDSSHHRTRDGNHEYDNDKDFIILLPPVSVATQCVQSVSILIQNVSRATSLYFLLSNNRINELINFPLERYMQALLERQKELDAAKTKKDAENTSRSPASFAEIAELTTYFISFLKSLAIRMNTETLQFFLEYQSEVPQSDGSVASGSTGGGMGGSGRGRNRLGGTASNRHFSSSHESEEHEQDPHDLISELEVDFPLYARTLQFCSQDQDSFVRITAMNICLNTIRLATVTTPPYGSLDAFDHLAIIGEGKERKDTPSINSIISSDEEENTELKPDTNNPSSDNNLKYSAPDGTLVNVDLPTRERLAIAYHVCSPSRVQGLVSPIFIQLTHLCADLMESIRTLEKIELTHSRNNDKYDAQRDKVLSTIDSIVADLQNELMLLDDLLEVGLTSLNEQTIEMMLATFIYPSILQPLSTYFQQQPFHGTDEAFYHESMSNFDTSTKTSENSTNSPTKSTATSSSKPLYPFPFKSVSNSLAQSGLLGSNGNLQSMETSDSNSPQNVPDEKLGVFIDSSPPKAALLALIAVLNTVKNRRAIYFISTAIFHPLAPNSSGGNILRQKPNILSLTNKKVRIQVDPISSDLTAFHFQHMLRSFGKSNKDTDHKDDESKDLKVEECIFSFSPSLAYILEMGENGEYASLKDETSKLALRENPYRRALLACLSGTDGMVPLRKLAVYAVDTSIQALDGYGVNTILFGVGKNQRRRITRRTLDVGEIVGQGENIFSDDKLSPSQQKRTGSTNIFAKELISSLCESVMTASLCANGYWRLEYDIAATNALTGIISKNFVIKSETAQLIEHKRWQSASYLSKLPSLIGAKNGVGTVNQNENDLNMNMDRMFRDSYDQYNACVIDYLVFDRVNETFWTSLSKKSRMEDALRHISSSISMKHISMDRSKDAFTHAAASALAHLQLDTFATALNHESKSNDGIKKNKPRYGLDKTLLHCVRPEISLALLDEVSPGTNGPTSLDGTNQNRTKTPVSGEVLTLIGRSAFPCVCEVSKASATLFKDVSSSVIADGVKWQSLYLVIIGRYMVLAEPVKSSGGNGRIVTSCLLSCITVQKDKSPIANSSTARRLIITHTSLKQIAPGVFNADHPPQMNNSSYKSYNSHHNSFYGKRGGPERNILVSRMDLWFEDKNAADIAYENIFVKAIKYREKRGKLLRAALHCDELN